jgi:hypothetical protein
VQAIATAESFGLASYHGVAPAFAIRALTASDPDSARADVTHALEIGRRATTTSASPTSSPPAETRCSTSETTPEPHSSRRRERGSTVAQTLASPVFT